MESKQEHGVGRALEVAHDFLGRWQDCFTRSSADDIAQDAVIEAWRRRPTMHRPERWDAFVRTLVRRYRCRALLRDRRLRSDSLDENTGLAEQVVARAPCPASVDIGGRIVAVSWCVEQLPSVLSRLGPLNECIVRSYYEGFSCSEIAARYCVPEDYVKVRLYRCRARIRREFEGRVRTARLAGEPCFLFGE